MHRSMELYGDGAFGRTLLLEVPPRFVRVKTAVALRIPPQSEIGGNGDNRARFIRGSP
jgi:hypothetical protein